LLSSSKAAAHSVSVPEDLPAYRSEDIHRRRNAKIYNIRKVPVICTLQCGLNSPYHLLYISVRFPVLKSDQKKVGFYRSIFFRIEIFNEKLLLFAIVPLRSS
jgi:hypothetical protein